MNDTCMQKIKIGHRAKFRDRDNFFSAGFISVSRDFTPYFHFRCVARATFDRNLIHSADVFLSYGVCRLLARTAKSPFETASLFFSINSTDYRELIHFHSTTKF